MGFAPEREPLHLGVQELVDEIVIDSVQQTLDFNGASGDGAKQFVLDGDRDGKYLLEVDCVKLIADVAAYSLRPNNATANQARVNQSNNGSTITPTTSTDLKLITGTSAETWTARCEITRIDDVWHFNWLITNTGNAQPSGNQQIGSGAWNDPANLVRMVVHAVDATGFQIGSKARLYRFNRDLPAVPLGAREFIDRITVSGGAVQDLTFEAGGADTEFGWDVNGDEDEYYIIKGSGVIGNTGNIDYRLEPNGVATEQSGDGFVVGDSTNTPFELTDMGIQNADFNESIDFEIRFHAARRGLRRTCRIESVGFEESSGNTKNMVQAYVTWDNTTALVTSLVLASDNASGWGDGTVIELFRERSRPTPRISVVSVESEYWVKPAIAHPKDLEFDTDVLPSKVAFTETVDFGTDPDSYTAFASGDAKASLNSFRKSWLYMQGANDAVNYQLHQEALETDLWVETRFAVINPTTGSGAVNDSIYQINWTPTDTGEPDLAGVDTCLVGYRNTNGQRRIICQHLRTSVLSVNVTVNLSQTDPLPTRLGISKDDTVFSGWMEIAGRWEQLSNLDHSGHGALDRIHQRWQNASSGRPFVIGTDFLRFRDTAKGPLR